MLKLYRFIGILLISILSTQVFANSSYNEKIDAYFISNSDLPQSCVLESTLKNRDYDVTLTCGGIAVAADVWLRDTTLFDRTVEVLSKNRYEAKACLNSRCIFQKK